MRIFLLALMAVAALIGYGYYDAYSPKNVYPRIKAKIITPWGLYYDSIEDFGPINNGDLFIAIYWDQPNDTQMVSGIYVDANVFNGTELHDNIKAPCKRGGSTWLAFKSFKNGNSDRICFVKINKPLPDDNSGDLDMNMARDRAANLKLEFGTNVMAVNKPFQYITWINNGLLKSKETFKSVLDLINSPFQRS